MGIKLLKGYCYSAFLILGFLTIYTIFFFKIKPTHPAHVFIHDVYSQTLTKDGLYNYGKFKLITINLFKLYFEYSPTLLLYYFILKKDLKSSLILSFSATLLGFYFSIGGWSSFLFVIPLFLFKSTQNYFDGYNN
jgi:hypothetical protein